MTKNLPSRICCTLLFLSLIGCQDVARVEPGCLVEARTGASELASLPASARGIVSDALAGECESPGVACSYRVEAPEHGGLSGEISVVVTFVRADDEGCLYMPGDGKAWRFTSRGELIGEDVYL